MKLKLLNEKSGNQVPFYWIGKNAKPLFKMMFIGLD